MTDYSVSRNFFSADFAIPSLTASVTSVAIGEPLDLLEPTHRGLHRFIPRHEDEIEIDIGDPVYVQKEAEDLWCEGAFYMYFE